MSQERESRDERWDENNKRDGQPVLEARDEQRSRCNDHELGHALRQLVEDGHRDASGIAQLPARCEQTGAGSMAGQRWPSVGHSAGDGDDPEHRSAGDSGSLRQEEQPLGRRENQDRPVGDHSEDQQGGICSGRGCHGPPPVEVPRHHDGQGREDDTPGPQSPAGSLVRGIGLPAGVRVQ